MNVPPFPVCQVQDHDGWRKLPGKRVYEGPYVQIEECSYVTPGKSGPFSFAADNCQYSAAMGAGFSLKIYQCNF